MAAAHPQYVMLLAFFLSLTAVYPLSFLLLRFLIMLVFCSKPSHRFILLCLPISLFCFSKATARRCLCFRRVVHTCVCAHCLFVRFFKLFIEAQLHLGFDTFASNFRFPFLVIAFFSDLPLGIKFLRRSLFPVASSLCLYLSLSQPLSFLLFHCCFPPLLQSSLTSFYSSNLSGKTTNFASSYFVSSAPLSLFFCS